MGTLPDLASVRAYVRVPATTLSDEDLERMMGSAQEDQAARCSWPAMGSTFLAIAGMTATVGIHHGTPGAAFSLIWGDGAREDVVTDAAGSATAEHDYAAPGDYPASVRDPSGTTVGAKIVTVPGDSASADITYPDALSQAFLRRVQREIAGRNLPLGMVGLESEYGPASIPAFDALVEHHEHAFRRVVLS